MKKLFLVFILAVAFAFSAQAQQISDNAIGLRLGDSDGFGAEISYQRAVGDNNRLEFGLGWRDGNNFSAFRILGLYQWVWTLDGSFNWYAGVGGGVATYNIGIEYDFDIPLLISLDFRPEIGLGNFNDDVDFDIALGLRYQF